MSGQRGHDRVGHVARCHLELERDDPGAVPVELPGHHRLVQPTQAAGLGHLAGLGRRRDPARGQPHRLLHAPLGLLVRGPDHRCDDVGGVEGHPSGPVHALAEGAVLAPPALAPGSLGDGGVLHRGDDVDQPLAVRHDRQPLVAATGGARPLDRSRDPRRTHGHRPGRVIRCPGGRRGRDPRRPLVVLLRRDHVSPFPVTRSYRPEQNRTGVPDAVFPCSRINFGGDDPRSGPRELDHRASRNAQVRGPAGLARALRHGGCMRGVTDNEGG